KSVNADLVIYGHTHLPMLTTAEEMALFNPGSHMDPRNAVATHGELKIHQQEVETIVRDSTGEIVEKSVLTR
ncbi:MAG: metallophosphoesterase family protein, partial [Halobacteriaceae archaeon]